MKKSWKQMKIIVGQGMQRTLRGPSPRKTYANFVNEADVKVTQLRRLMRGPNQRKF